MLGPRLFSHRWVVRLICAWALILGLWPHPGESAPLPPLRAGDPEVNLDVLRETLERRIIRERLLGLGASAEDADAVIARLSPEERTELAARVDELDAGGGVVVAVLGALILAGLVVVLFFELLGRRVVSQP